MTTPRHSKVIILGSGPAGYTAAIYAARAMLKPLIIQGIQPGGQLTITTDVENYPGFAKVIQGPWLMEEMQAQAEHVGTEVVMDHVVKVTLNRRPFLLECDSGDSYTCDCPHHLHRRAGPLARNAERAAFQGPRRLRLRHLRRVLLSRQGSHRRRRRQYRGRGGDLPHQLRPQGDGGPPARQLPRRADPPGPPVQEPQDRGGLGHGDRGDHGHRGSQERHGRAPAQRQDRVRSRRGPSMACSLQSATRRQPNCSSASYR